MNRRRIRTIHYGIGAIGSEAVRLALRRPDIEVAGAIDAHPDKAGRDLGELAAVGRPLGIEVSADAESVLKRVDADVVLHATGSHLPDVSNQLLQITAAGLSVVSSCEELSFPWQRYPEMAQELDRRARDAGVRILGSGVNPGFIMDTLPLVLATACEEVHRVRAARIVDVGQRRRQLQLKVGVGLSPEVFRRRLQQGQLGHVGLRESACMIADGLGWPLDEVAETVEPVVATTRRKVDDIVVERGQVAGVRQVARVMSDGREVVCLELEMAMAAEKPRDEISIEGRPSFSVTIPGGIQGDLATAAIMVNCVPAMAGSQAVGLLTMRDMPMVPYLLRRSLHEE